MTGSAVEQRPMMRSLKLAGGSLTSRRDSASKVIVAEVLEEGRQTLQHIVRAVGTDDVAVTRGMAVNILVRRNAERRVVEPAVYDCWTSVSHAVETR